MLTPWKESYDQHRQHIKKQKHYFVNKDPCSQGYGFSSSHVRCESWTIKKAERQRIDAFELWCWRRLLRVHPKGNQSWIFFGRTDAEAETPIFWPPNVKSWLIWKELDAGKDWRWEEKGLTEDEMVGWHHQLNGHEFEQAPGVGGGQGSLVCCSPRGCKESEMTEGQNWREILNIPWPLSLRLRIQSTESSAIVTWVDSGDSQITLSGDPGQKQ